MSVKPLSASDKKWQAECDANSLARAAEVQADAARMKSAQAAAKRITAEKEKELAGMRRAAGVAKPTSNARQPVAARKKY